MGMWLVGGTRSNEMKELNWLHGNPSNSLMEFVISLKTPNINQKWQDHQSC